MALLDGLAEKSPLAKLQGAVKAVGKQAAATNLWSGLVKSSKEGARVGADVPGAPDQGDWTEESESKPGSRA